MASRVKSLLYNVFPVASIFILLAASLSFIYQSTTNPSGSDFPESGVIALYLITLTILLVFIIANIIRAIRHLRSKKSGSRFTVRLMSAFAILTLAPVLVVSYISMDYIGTQIDVWFDIKIERALEDSLELSEQSLKTGSRIHLRRLEQMAEDLFELSERDYPYFIEKRRGLVGAQELLLLDASKRVIAYSRADSRAGSNLFSDNFPDENIFRVLSHNGKFLGLEPNDKGGLNSRVAVTLQKDVGSKIYTLTGLFPITSRFTSLAESVQQARGEYSELKLKNSNIKFGFRLSLFIIMLLSVLFSLWAAFIYSKRLTRPISNLLDGTQAVASGHLQTKLSVKDNDDFALLARSFNIMTSKLFEARKERENSQLEVQRQHDYLNIVINHLTSGVMTLTTDNVVRRINVAADELLHIEGNDIINQKLESSAKCCQFFSDFATALLPLLNSGNRGEWRTEIVVVHNNKRHLLLCRGAPLPHLLSGESGTVIVFDDVTEMVQAEHDAAWSEVAMRLAHEIKNPLTPIQLSAERLQHRLLPELSEESGDLLKRMTQTITQQVDNMKTMVNAFSDYAKTPALQLQQIDVNNLIKDVVVLYQENEQCAEIVLHLKSVPSIPLDSLRIRQVFINIVKNSLEAMGSQNNQGHLLISTELRANNEIIICFSDDGPGVDESLIQHIFDPYISSKERGSGLGLAIVKKIIEEHSGRIMVGHSATGGAEFTISLPVARDSHTKE